MYFIKVYLFFLFILLSEVHISSFEIINIKNICQKYRGGHFLIIRITNNMYNQ